MVSCQWFKTEQAQNEGCVLPETQEKIENLLASIPHPDSIFTTQLKREAHCNLPQPVAIHAREFCLLGSFAGVRTPKSQHWLVSLQITFSVKVLLWIAFRSPSGGTSTMSTLAVHCVSLSMPSKFAPPTTTPTPPRSCGTSRASTCRQRRAPRTSHFVHNIADFVHGCVCLRMFM